MPDLIKTNTSERIYVVVGGKRRWVPNGHTFNYLQFKLQDVRVISDAEMNAIQEADAIPEFPDASLIAFAVRTDWPDPHIAVPRDHTFVISRDGHRWGCFGRSDPTELGVRIVAYGHGSISDASCIAGGDGHAGLVQGITGACHQAANRIMFCAATTVQQAAGFVASVAVYGLFGPEPEWGARLAHCMPQQTATDILARIIVPGIPIPQIPGLPRIPDPTDPIRDEVRRRIPPIPRPF